MLIANPKFSFAVVEFSHAGAVQVALTKTGKQLRGREVYIEQMGGAKSDENGAVTAESSTFPSFGNKGKGQSGKSSPARKGSTNEVKQEKRSRSRRGSQSRKRSRSRLARENNAAKESPKSTAANKPKSLSEMFAAQSIEINTWAELQKKANEYDSLEALTAEHADGERVKSWLSAVGLKCGGTPAERCARMWKAKDFASLDECGKDLKGTAKIKTNKPASLPEKK